MKRKTPVFPVRFGNFSVELYLAFAWTTRTVIRTIHVVQTTRNRSTFRFHVLWKTGYPSRILVSMLSIVSLNAGSVSIICAILLHAEIAVV